MDEEQHLGLLVIPIRQRHGSRS